jgi:hypothetical protein
MTQELQTVAIFSGEFTSKGNFSGYDASGERIHIPGRTMNAAGLNKDTKIEFPFYCLVKSKSFNKRDANGNITEEQFTREQAGSVFTDKEKLFAAANANKLLAVEAKVELKKAASAVGLTSEEQLSFLQLA